MYVTFLWVQCSSMILDWLMPKFTRFRGSTFLANI